MLDAHLIRPSLSLRGRLIRKVRWLGLVMLCLGAPWANATTPRLEPVRVQLKWKHQFQFAGYYAAMLQGFYREAGLEVRLQEATPGRDPAEAVLAGEAEFGVGTSELLLLRAQGRPVVVLATIYQHSPLVLLALGDATGLDLQALHDRPMMVEPQSAELFAYFRDEGLDPARLKIVHHTFAVDDLLSGRVAAMTGYLTDEPFTLQRAGIAYTMLSPRAGGIDFYGDNLFTTEAHLAQAPEQVRAFRDATLRGWEYALERPEEIIDHILTLTGRKSREHLLFEAEKTRQLMHPGVIEVGHMNPGRWRHIADTYATFGMVPEGFDLDGFLYDPDPRPNLRPLYWALVLTGIAALAAFGWITPLVRLNRRLRRGERQYRELAENAPFPVAISDFETGSILFVNRRCERLLGEDEDRLLRRRAIEFYARAEDRARLLEDLVAGGAAAPREVELRDATGRSRWTLLSAGRIEFGGRTALVVAFQDIDALRAAQDELRAARDVAEHANQARNRYLAAMSHEIRTPLNGVLGLSEIMLGDEELDADHAQNLAHIKSAASALVCLVNELLDWSQLEAGAMRLETAPVVLEEILNPLAGLFRAATEARGIELVVELDPALPAAVQTDPLRLRQILSNLLSNAVKFTATGRVTLRAQPAPACEGAEMSRIHISVIDTGPGIAPEAQAKLFAPYVQADASIARRFGGSGLGLSISRSLAHLLGGDLTLRSREGEGSVFTLELPNRAPAP